ncbi:MAG: PilZ domain-containing protein [Desulfobacterales bacterium]|jgi:hypothetical protein|nr:PilZ domain-containing protein [Desulfobacterales bacterium]
MGEKERRKYSRVQIFDPISYLGKDSKGKVIGYNIAVVRNVSQTGIQIETFQAISSDNISLMFFDLANKEIEIKGEVVYCTKNDAGQHNIGIRLVGTAAENLQFIKALVKSYHYQKEKSRLVISPGILN